MGVAPVLLLLFIGVHLGAGLLCVLFGVRLWQYAGEIQRRRPLLKGRKEWYD